MRDNHIKLMHLSVLCICLLRLLRPGSVLDVFTMFLAQQSLQHWMMCIIIRWEFIHYSPAHIKVRKGLWKTARASAAFCYTVLKGL